MLPPSDFFGREESSKESDDSVYFHGAEADDEESDNPGELGFDVQDDVGESRDDLHYSDGWEDEESGEKYPSLWLQDLLITPFYSWHSST